MCERGLWICVDHEHAFAQSPGESSQVEYGGRLTYAAFQVRDGDDAVVRARCWHTSLLWRMRFWIPSEFFRSMRAISATGIDERYVHWHIGTDSSTHTAAS